MMNSYKILIAIPIIITILAGGLIALNGIDEGIELKGGSIAYLKMNKHVSSDDLKKNLVESLNINNVEIISNTGNDVTIELGSELNQTALEKGLAGSGKIVSYNSIGPVLSEEAMTQIIWALGFAFLFMGITVFAIFREPVPAIGIILAAFCDIIIAVGGMSLFHIPLSIASVGALLMLIGYSVDTDILLTTRLLRKKEGTVEERTVKAMKTGLTMSAAAIGSMIVLYIVTIFLIPEADTLSDIAAVLTIGLLADIIATWLMNLGFLRWYIGSRFQKRYKKEKGGKS
ncbi:protein-export membrane protein SecF [Methanobrevibacter filiformis]|uniref:Protein-export membrane protein SecF n=2 Tax=Methanobrevibacter filiformis TaxID=55758 RepID=A0A166A804_9EURY|nr:protein-export membrane protein SecF [Methanobrevibacter filiformis]